MKIAVCELPNLLSANSNEWWSFVSRLEATEPSFLVMNEMPFGPWLAANAQYDDAKACESLESHDFSGLPLQSMTVLSSRPVPAKSGRLCNEAFVMSESGYKAVHQKHYFPEEPGFFEQSWFQTEKFGFDVAHVEDVGFGFLLCTELMFLEWARHYGRSGASVIVVPRATRAASIANWKAAASIAAVTSGCYVASSNRSGLLSESVSFGGNGFIFGPDGRLLAETSAATPLVTVDIDLEYVQRCKLEYPCYVDQTAGQQAAMLA